MNLTFPEDPILPRIKTSTRHSRKDPKSPERRKRRKRNYDPRSKYLALQTSSRTETDTVHKTSENSSFHIVEDLLVDVLSRLPLKSLARFKCVSKQWQSLIQNTMTNNPKLLVLVRSEDKSFSFLSIDHETRVESVCSPMEEHALQCRTVKVHSSCNGLLLIQIDDDLFVWNPLTKFFKKELTLDGILDIEWFHGDGFFLIDLCYDYANNEYKVLLVEPWVDGSWDGDNFYIATFEAKIWKQKHFNFENMSPGPIFNGYRHWISFDRYGSFEAISSGYIPETHIVYFDPSRNMFIEVAKPPKIGDQESIVGLVLFDGYLCMSRWAESNLEFLAMKEYRNGNSWESIVIFPTIPEIYMEPLFKTKRGEVVISRNIDSVSAYDVDSMSGSNTSVSAYDVDSNFLREVLVPMKGDSFSVICYEESWSSPERLVVKERKTGLVKWFNYKKRYGFIIPEDGSEDLFVHQTSIRSKGFRSLKDGESVEFVIVSERDGRIKADDVTGPNRGPLQIDRNLC